MRALPDRWVIAIGGAALMLVIGTVYSWAIFAQMTRKKCADQDQRPGGAAAVIATH